jgi:hypothetical protein
MDISTLGAVAQIAEAGLVAVTVIFIWYELRETQRMTRAANTHKLFESLTPFYMAAMQDRDLLRLYGASGEDIAKLDSIDRLRHRAIHLWWLSVFENFYRQAQGGFVERGYAEGWDRSLAAFVCSPGITAIWPSARHQFDAAFVAHVENLQKAAVTA